MKQMYSSMLASYISDFVAMKRSIGYLYESAEFYLRDFDNYCRLNGEGSLLSRELVLGWAEARNGEDPAVHKVRLSPIRELGKYMQSIGISDAFVLPTCLHRKTDRYVPHFFTKQELNMFFAACDTLKPHGAAHARHMVLPVLFRLLYCCGLRTCEARKLCVEHVDLHTGMINIVDSKNLISRRIPVSQDLLTLFQVYNDRVEKVFPDRIYFFPSSRSHCYLDLSVVFQRIWRSAGLGKGCGNRPRAYDFRHHFALSNLNRWIESGIDINSVLPYLSRYMGHSSIQSTDYYLHLVPEFFHTFRELVKNTGNLLPEVAYDE